MEAVEATVLIAEDDDGHAALIESNLRDAGLLNPITRFRNGKELWDYLTADDHRVGAYVLLLDLKMPVMDGYEVLARIKGSPELARIPVIVVTTTGLPEEIERCYDLGCNSYVTKPVDAGQFIEAVRALGMFLMVVEVPRLDAGDGKGWSNGGRRLA